MCNPNIVIANRRPRLVGHQGANGQTSELTQRLLGSLMREGEESAPAEVSVGDFKEAPPQLSSNLDPWTKYIEPAPEPPTYLASSPPIPLIPMPACKPKKRRRKPQKPGMTAKHQERHFVVHNYHDHANDPDLPDEESDVAPARRGGVTVAFPQKLHGVLEAVEADGFGHVISWQPHGRCFVIHKPKEFVDNVMPRYFNQTKLTSFQRQLNLYGFQRLTRGPDEGGYYHELFLRGRPHLIKRMVRTKVKGTKFKAASSPEMEPNFYNMMPVLVSPQSSDNECGGSHTSSEEYSSHRDAEGIDAVMSQPRYVEHVPPAVPFSMSTAPLSPPCSRSYGEQAALPPSLYLESPPLRKEVFPLSSSFDTLVESPTQKASNFSLLNPAPVVEDSSRSNVNLVPRPATSLLEDAVDELFLNGPDADDSIIDFVNSWEKSPQEMDDAQLGDLLDQLLQEV